MLLTALLCSSYSGSRGVQIHSHNDYQKNIPFYRAYSQQVNTIEADIYTAPASDDLLVAHDVQELDTALTLDEMYLDRWSSCSSKIKGAPGEVRNRYSH